MVFHYIQTEGTKVITQSNLYNGNGQRVQKQEGDNTINYFYQGNNVLYTTNGDGNKIGRASCRERVSSPV